MTTQPEKVVCMNAYTIDEEGDLTYTDVPEEIVGWSVYVRTEATVRGEPFEVSHDEDFEQEGIAREYALRISAELGLDPEDIRTY